jgi:hypothetical protein
VRAVAHAQAGGAGIAGQLQVVRGVADHQRALRASVPNSAISSCSMRGCGLPAVSSAVRVASNTRCRLHRLQRFVQAAAALAGGHRQPVVARLQRLQHLQRAVEQHQLVLAREVVVAVAPAQLRVALGRQAGHRMLQRVVRPRPMT